MARRFGEALGIIDEIEGDPEAMSCAARFVHDASGRLVVRSVVTLSQGCGCS